MRENNYRIQVHIQRPEVRLEKNIIDNQKITQILTGITKSYDFYEVEMLIIRILQVRLM